MKLMPILPWMLAGAAGLLVLMAASDPRTRRLPELRVKPCDDFEVTGDGLAAAWTRTEWVSMNGRTDAATYSTRLKLLYSTTGLYILFDGEDSKLTATLQEDFANLWTEDCFEAFFWTDERHTIYFEYEISPLGHELPILVPNIDGRFLGWRPWHYDGPRKIRKAISTRGGPARSGEAIEGWRAEVFIPYELLKPLGNVPPRPGTRWRANFYRMDYDGPAPAAWDWSRTGPSFHDFSKFGTLIFE